MTNYLGGYAGPTPVVIPVTKGADYRFTLRRRNSIGELVDWSAQVYVRVDLKDAPVTVQATVVGPDAFVRLESELCDQVRNSTTWQAIISIPGSPSYEPAAGCGTFERNDGRPRNG